MENATELETFTYITEMMTDVTEMMTNMTTDVPYEDYGIGQGLQTMVGVIFFIMAAVGIVGNLFVIVAVMLTRRLQTATNAFVVNLSVADLLACTMLPIQAVSLMGLQELSLGMCVTTTIVTVTSLGCSIITITLVAINRYILITKMKHVYQRGYTRLTVSLMIAGAWILAPLLMILASKRVCGVYLVKHDAEFLSWSVPILLLSSLVAVLVCYILIFVHVRRHVARSMASQSSTKRLDISITKNLLCVVCAFYICILPYTLVITISKFSSSQEAYYAAIVLCTVILNVNSIVNPIIYAARHPIFKPVFGHMIRCRWSRIPEPSSILKSLVTRSSRAEHSIDKSRSSSGKTDSEYV